MEITLNHLTNIIIAVGFIGSIITIWQFIRNFRKKEKCNQIIPISQHNTIQNAQLVATTSNTFSQVNIIQQNNIISRVNDNQILMLTIDKNTLKYIMIFVIGAICSYLTIKFIIKQKN